VSSYLPVEKQTIAKICASADDILEGFGILEPPVNIYQILFLKELPVDFRQFKSSKLEGIYLRNITGASIAINHRHAWVKKRFTAAHEFKHHLHDDPKSGSLLCLGDTKPVIEQRANRFAAEILVPPKLLQIVYTELERLDLLTINTLAKTFAVSYETMVFRLSTLKYINHKQERSLLSTDGRKQDKSESLNRDAKKISRIKQPSILIAWNLTELGYYCHQCGNALVKPNWVKCPFCGTTIDSRP